VGFLIGRYVLEGHAGLLYPNLRNGRVEGWKIGRMEEWKNGRLEDWEIGILGIGRIAGSKTAETCE
jgi:lactate dehydrogenase-like 2-hydroxyacid dehydrogenase